jgi:hypothetical protein
VASVRFMSRRLVVLAMAATLVGCAAVIPQSEQIRQQWPANLGDHRELSAVPFFPQSDYECGPAALAMLLAFDGVPASTETLIPEVYVPGRQGSLQAEMLAAPRRHGAVSLRLAPRLEDVLREVEAGSPVIVLQDYGFWPLRIWHYAVVVGYDRTAGKVVLRSGLRERLEMPIPVFEYTWRPSSYWAMVALPADRVAATAEEGAWLDAVAAVDRVSTRAVARKAYLALLKRWPDSLNAAIGLANVHYAEGDLASSENVLRDAATKHPDAVVVLNNLAQVLADQERYVEALQLIDDAIARGGPFLAAAEETRARIVQRTKDVHQ